MTGRGGFSWLQLVKHLALQQHIPNKGNKDQAPQWNVVCQRYRIPKHSFIMWHAIKSLLVTKDELHTLGMHTPNAYSVVPWKQPIASFFTALMLLLWIKLLLDLETATGDSNGRVYFRAGVLSLEHREWFFYTIAAAAIHSNWIEINRRILRSSIAHAIVQKLRTDLRIHVLQMERVYRT